jgi:hypothetical protein
MKNLVFILLTINFLTCKGQTSCFKSEDDVMLYIVDKSFESNDGKISVKFNPSDAILRSGNNTFTYAYEQFNYLGSGYKGSITLLNLSDGSSLLLFVSCKEKMMTDNKGTLLYEKGTVSNNSISYSTVKIGDLEVMTKDLGEMNWDDAMKACADLGNGWRLPTKEELNILYQNKDKIGGFGEKRVWYWSSTESDATSAYSFSFSSGDAYGSNKTGTDVVRAVRSF